MTTTTLTTLVEETAELLESFSPELAEAWRSNPFGRVNLAFAFAAGFAKDPSDDVHPTASLVVQVALKDRESRSNVQEVS